MVTGRVLYTDPVWLIEGMSVDERRATVERQVLGTQVELRFGPFADGKYALTSTALLDAARDCDVIVAYRAQVNEQLLNAAGGRLKGIVRQGVGVDNLNPRLLEKRGIPGFNVPDYCVDEVAAHTLALALALERGIVHQHNTLIGGRFNIYAGTIPRRISQRTAGIVGLGRIGRAVARKLLAFYDRVLVYDPYIGIDLPEGYGAHGVSTLRELLEQSDLVTLHCPLTAETTEMVNDAFLGFMRSDALLINAARGKLVDPVSLAQALNAGRIAGAGLDVFSPENPHDDPRWTPVLKHPNVVLTSHRAFLSLEAEQSSRLRVAQTVRSLLAGEHVSLGLVSAQ